MKHIRYWAVLALLVGPSLALGQAYQVNLFGTKQIGMGHVGTAFHQDGAALAFNPAGISFVRNGVTVGFSPVNVQSSYVDRNAFGRTYESDNGWSPPFNAYGIYTPEGSNFTFGLGVYTPFGGGYDWGRNWVGADDLISLDLAAIYIQPTVSYQLADNLSVGASFTYVLGSVNLQRAIPNVNFPDGSTGSVELDSDASGIGFALGIQWDATEDWSLGLSYRHEVEAEADGGDAIFNVPASLRANFPAGNTFDAQLPLPGMVALGVAYKGMDRWVLAADINYILWSSYESLDFDFAQNTAVVQDLVQPRNYDDAWAFRVGAQYALIENKLDIRGGAYYSITPIQSGFVTPESPDNDRLSGHLGFSWHINEKFSVDGAFQYLRTLERDDFNRATNLNGTWNTQAFIPSLGLQYNFGN